MAIATALVASRAFNRRGLADGGIYAGAPPPADGNGLDEAGLMATAERILAWSLAADSVPAALAGGERVHDRPPAGDSVSGVALRPPAGCVWDAGDDPLVPGMDDDLITGGAADFLRDAGGPDAIALEGVAGDTIFLGDTVLDDGVRRGATPRLPPHHPGEPATPGPEICDLPAEPAERPDGTFWVVRWHFAERCQIAFWQAGCWWEEAPDWAPGMPSFWLRRGEAPVGVGQRIFPGQEAFTRRMPP